MVAHHVIAVGRDIIGVHRTGTLCTLNFR
jgi:hypothetical protein